MDVAALGFSVDSSPLVKATASLDGLANSAVKAEAATASFNTETSTTATTTARVSPAATAAARAMDAQATSASNAARAMSTASVAAQRLAANQNVLRGQTGNIAAQFQDIAVQLQAGQSPFTIALQQGTQLSAVLGATGGGLRGTLSALGGGFMSLLSPVSLITIGLIAAGGAAIQYFTGTSDEAEKASAALKNHNNLIKGATDEWGAAVPALQAYNKELAETERLQKLIAAEKASSDDQWTTAVNASKALNDEVSKGLEFIRQYGDASALSGIIDDYNVLKQAIADHNLQAGQAQQFEDELSKALADTGNKGAVPLIAALERVIATIDQARAKAKQFSDEAANNTYVAPINIPDRMAGLPENGVPRPGTVIPTPDLFRENTPDGLQPTGKATGNATAEVDKQVQAYQKLIATQQEQAQNLQLEASLIGASVAERARQTAALQAEQQLRQQHIDTLSREGQAYIANAKALADAKTQIDRQQAAYTSLQQAEGSLVDTFVSGFSTIGGSWKDTLRNMAQQFLQWIDTLAIANPIKNALTGSNLPTLADLFSGKPSVPGANTTGTMTVTAGVVNVAGGVTGGLGNVPLTPGANTTLTDFLKGTPAVNGVRPDVVNGQVVNSPVNSAASATVSRLLNPANQNAPVTSTDMALYQQAISKIESGSFAGNYNALGPTLKNGDYAIGRYQIMASNVPDWSQKYLGQQITPDQLRANPAYQDAIFNGEFGGYVSKYGPSGAASKWFTGSAFPSGKMDALGTTDNSYVKQFNANLSALQQTTSNASTSMTGLTDSSKSLNSGFTNLFSTLGQTPSTTSSSSGGFFSWLGGLFGGGPSVGGGMAGNKIAAAPRPNIPAAPQSASGGSQKVRVEVVNTVDKSGNLKPVIKSISQETVDERVPGHIKAYDKDHLPKRVRQISGDKWARG